MKRQNLTRIERYNVALAVLFTTVAAIFFDRPVVIGVAIGSVVSCVNFYGIHKLVEMMTQTSRGGWLSKVLIGLKMILLVPLLFLAIKYLPLSVPALALGFSIFLLSTGVESVRFALAEKSS